MCTTCPCASVRLEEFVIVFPFAENFSKRTVDTSSPFAFGFVDGLECVVVEATSGSGSSWRAVTATLNRVVLAVNVRTGFCVDRLSQCVHSISRQERLALRRKPRRVDRLCEVEFPCADPRIHRRIHRLTSRRHDDGPGHRGHDDCSGPTRRSALRPSLIHVAAGDG